jgi:hypothetical protein
MGDQSTKEARKPHEVSCSRNVDHNPRELRLFLKLLRSRLRFDEDCDLVSAYDDDGGGGIGS